MPIFAVAIRTTHLCSKTSWMNGTVGSQRLKKHRLNIYCSLEVVYEFDESFFSISEVNQIVSDNKHVAGKHLSKHLVVLQFTGLVFKQKLVFKPKGISSEKAKPVD